MVLVSTADEFYAACRKGQTDVIDSIPETGWVPPEWRLDRVESRLNRLEDYLERLADKQQKSTLKK